MSRFGIHPVKTINRTSSMRNRLPGLCSGKFRMKRVGAGKIGLARITNYPITSCEKHGKRLTKRNTKESARMGHKVAQPLIVSRLPVPQIREENYDARRRRGLNLTTSFWTPLRQVWNYTGLITQTDESRFRSLLKSAFLRINAIIKNQVVSLSQFH